jgi:uncharacterized protein
MPDDSRIETLEALSALYGLANPNSLAKEMSYLTPEYQKWIETAPFFALASSGPGELDCTPRGDATGEVLHVLDKNTLIIPDRRGNNRLDTLKNIITDAKVALLFLIPGINETLRINGNAYITTDCEHLEHFRFRNRLPASVIVVEIETVYFQCARALKRAQLWNTSAWVSNRNVPTAGQMAKGAVPNFDAEAYDDELQDRQNATLY